MQLQTKIILVLSFLLFFTDLYKFYNNDTILNSLQIILLVHPYNKVQILPHTFGGIDSQNYSKFRINIYIQTEKIYYDSQDTQNTENTENTEDIEGKLKANLLTIEMLKRWVQNNRDKYNEIELIIGTHNYDYDDTKYWSYGRFKKIIKMKEEALKLAIKNWADYLLFIDADVVLTNPNTFSSMVESGEMIIAPMLYSLGTYSNYWAGITESGYYKRTDDYLPILEQQHIGRFHVPMIHTCVFLNLRYYQTHSLTFDSRKISHDLPFDDIIAFAKSAGHNSISLFIDNHQVWGHVPPPIENNANLDSLEQNLIDLELESLVEGSSFPISDTLESYSTPPVKDKLYVDNVYMINLARRYERRNRMLKCFHLLGIHVEVWTATDGKELNSDIIKTLGIKILDGYLDPYHKRPMTFGEIGCFMSHYRIWQDIINRNFSNAIIFEDDVRFERNFKYKWKKMFTTLDTDQIDFVYLGRKRHTNEETRFSDYFVIPTYSYWTIGYFITQTGARKLIDAKPLEKLLPVDEFLPVMYHKHPKQEWSINYDNRNLKALSVDPLLIYPTHYVGDSAYFSDTEDSKKIDSNQEITHFKHSEL